MPVYLVGVDLFSLNKAFPGCANIEPDYFTSRWEIIEDQTEPGARSRYIERYRHWLTPDERPSVQVLLRCDTAQTARSSLESIRRLHHEHHDAERRRVHPDLHPTDQPTIPPGKELDLDV